MIELQKENENAFHEIAKEISTKFGKLLGTHVYIAIIDGAGFIYYLDSPLDKLSEFIQNFVETNFTLLNVGEHSLPLGGINLAFFKISRRAVIVLHTLKGRSGQLLAFKSNMFDWTKRVDELIGEINLPSPSIQIQDVADEIEPEILPPAFPGKDKPKRLKTIPILKKKLSGKEKFPLEVARILQYCDGNRSIEDICEETNYSRSKVDRVIRDYRKKKWIDIKRILS